MVVLVLVLVLVVDVVFGAVAVVVGFDVVTTGLGTTIGLYLGAAG